MLELDLSGRDDLKQLSTTDLTGVESLNLEDCTSLEQLPEGIDLKILVLDYCTRLKKLTANTKVSEILLLRGCASLEQLPEGLNLQMLVLDRCTGLKQLPSNLKVSEILSLRHCTGLEQLPENLNVESLNIDFCTNLKQLPDRLTVGGIQIKSLEQLEQLQHRAPNR